MYLLGNWLIDMSSEVEEQEVEFVPMWVFVVRCIFTKVRLITTRIIFAGLPGFIFRHDCEIVV